MQIFKEIRPLKAFLQQAKKSPVAIGFVPTMGALHQGHLALVEASKKENTITVCSIFVNPTQFNNPDDLARYPSTLSNDVELLKKVGCEVVFCPAAAEMYVHANHIKFDFGSLDKILEGEFRPGHFSGVALVVSKLLNIVTPQRAYFGQKDFQQAALVKKLVADLNFDTEIILVPIVREADGLAMSSRNVRLTTEHRKNAVAFYHGLHKAKALLLAGTDFDKVQAEVKRFCESHAGIQLEYLALADSTNLSLTKNVTEQSILLIAGYAGEVRLIDNLMLTDEN
ncbi:MAG: pantoate--beta-alanine ligase [Cytophagales bacterium]|nr:pantoate--beta-alanine ligase [Cytophagales bacterium]